MSGVANDGLRCRLYRTWRPVPRIRVSEITPPGHTSMTSNARTRFHFYGETDEAVESASSEGVDR